jgi:hypothetical protein
MPRKVKIKPRIGIPRVCKYEGCKKPFTAYRADKEYHTARCRAYASIARKVNPPEMLAEPREHSQDFTVSDPFASLMHRKDSQDTASEIKCAWHGCDQMFVPFSAKHKYHSDACRYSAFVENLKTRKAPTANKLLDTLDPATKKKMLEKLGIAVSPDVAHKIGVDAPPESLAMLTDASEAQEPSEAEQDQGWFDTLKLNK